MRWTAKLPALIGAAIAFLIGIVGLRKSLLIGLPVIIIAVLLLGYSTSIREWCVPNSKRLGTMTWGQGELHSPSFWDCVRMGG